jgi:hypothetical protein
MSGQPLARSQDVVVEAIGDELLVFDRANGRAHSLNTAAALVWQACNGSRTREQISEHCQLDPLAVDLALDNLADSKLLEDYDPPAERVSRRTAIRRIAFTGASIGVALPVIRSIVAPSSAMAGSTVGSACASQADCTHAGSHCHSDGQCHPSTCHPLSASIRGRCGSDHPCCVNFMCVSFGGSYSCLDAG